MRFEKLALEVPKILLPKDDVDLYRWAVIACDQYTSEPEYWKDVERLVVDSPSTLNLVFPEVYLEDDPPRMYKVMRQTDKPCLAFKILAAGRLCDKQEWVEQAFESAFRQIKANDAVIVGMYPEYEDQPAINAAYVRRFSSLSG